MLLDMAELLHGSATATATVTRAVEHAGDDPRRRALVLALASDYSYGIRGGRRAVAIEAISCAEKAGPAAVPALHRALINLAVAKVHDLDAAAESARAAVAAHGASPLRVELAHSLLVLGRIERRRKARKKPAACCFARTSWPRNAAIGRSPRRSSTSCPGLRQLGPGPSSPPRSSESRTSSAAAPRTGRSRWRCS